MRVLPPALLFVGLGLSGPVASAGDLTQADVRRAMADHGDAVKACYLKHGMGQRDATGKVTVSIVVLRDGSSRDVTVDAPGVRGPALRRCIASDARTWTWPASGSVTEVELPFLFQHTRLRGSGAPSASRSRR
jgi:hypothetical protein